MTMTPGLRKFALTLHVISSVGWLGAVIAYLMLAIAAVANQEPLTIRTVWISLELIGWFAIVPLCVAALLSGLVQSLGTPWGLFRHYWVFFKLALTILATVILMLHMPTVSYLAGLAADTGMTHFNGLAGEIVHAGGGLLVLIVTTALSVYKPRGLTPYGWRKQHKQRSIAPAGDATKTA